MRDLQGNERVGDWMQTLTGRMFFPLDPRQDEIDVRDIARGLAMRCRYSGQITEFYSVAEHSVIVSYAVANEDPSAAREALLHDATEAYLGDMIRPLKSSMPTFCAAEDQLEAVIFARFGVEPTPETRAVVKRADNRILIDERQVRTQAPAKWHGLDGLEALGVQIHALHWQEAEHLWMQRFVELFPEEFKAPTLGKKPQP